MGVQAILATALVAAVAASFSAYSATGVDAPSASEKCMSEMKGASEMKCMADMKGMSDMKGMTDMKGSDEMMHNMSMGQSTGEKPKKLTAAQDRSKHFHPRDGK